MDGIYFLSSYDLISLLVFQQLCISNKLNVRKMVKHMHTVAAASSGAARGGVWGGR